MIFALIDRILSSLLARQGVQRRYLETSYGRIHTLDGRGGGQLPPIVLIHGIGANAISYYPLIKRLLPHTRRLIAIDLIAHGASQVPAGPMNYEVLRDAAVETLCATLDEPAIIFGNSLGGGVSLYFATTNPDRVHSLVLASPAGAPFTETDLAEVRGLFQIDSPTKALDFLARVYHRRPPYAIVAYQHLRQIYSAPSIRALFASLKPGEVIDSQRLRQLPMPIYVMWGKSDRILPLAHLAYFRETLPKPTKFEELHEMGHCPFLERPSAVAERLIHFVG